MSFKTNLPRTGEVNRLKRLYELSMTLSGDPMEIFIHVARLFGELLDVKVVCLSEIRGSELYFLSVYVRGQIFVNAGHCPLEVTPCATVESSKDVRIYDSVQERFPKAGFLKDHNAYSYCGFPSLDNEGNVVAVTCLLDDRPHEFTVDDQELLRIAGQRIGLEIARKRLNEAQQATFEALHCSEGRLREVLEAAGHSIWEVDAGGRFTYLTEGFSETFGYAMPDLLGRTLFEFQFAGDSEWVRDLFLSAVREKRRFRAVEHQIRSRTGHAIWISVSGAPLLDESGQVIGFRGTVTDITERKRSEQALQESEERQELALRGADLGMWDWNVQTGSVFYSDRWISMLGYSREEIEPRYEQWVRLVHPDDLPTVLSVLEAHLAGESPYYEVEHRLLAKEGTWKWIWSSGKVLKRDAGGFPLRAAGTHLDISVRKALEERLRQQQTQLTHAQRVTTAGELAATIVHEVNQPLGAIASHVGAATMEFSDVLTAHPGLKYTLDEIVRLTERVSGVVRGIRDLVRARSGVEEWVDIQALIEEILIFTGGELTRRQIRLVTEIPPALPRVRGERIQLQQLFLNLIVNAMDAMDEVEKNRRQLTLQAVLHSARMVAIRISDTGPGIADPIRAKLFEPFVTSKANGIGLGLPLCRTIAEMHGGKISAHSAKGQGASFEVTLPVGEGGAA